MKRRLLALGLASTVGLVQLSHTSAVFAQPNPESKAAADALFDEGRRLKGEGKFSEACPKFEEAQKLAPGMGGLYNLADCFEHIGRTASAWAGFREVAAQASAAGRSEHERDARTRVAALEPQLMRLKVIVAKDGASPGVEVKRDGAVMSPGVWGTAIPLDPGRHHVAAFAPGKQPWELTIDLKDPGTTLTVEVPPLLDQKPGPAVTPPPVLPPPLPGGPRTLPPPLVPLPPPEAVSKRPWQRPLGIGLTGLGAVGLGLGTAFGFMAKSTFDDAKPHCNDKNQCDPEGIGIRNDALTKGNIGTGIFVAGAVLAAGGAALWITAPSAPQAVGVSVGPGSVSLRGAF
ncbi:MAG: hypothetical protein ABI193_20235 [Minicystis sp.]